MTTSNFGGKKAAPFVKGGGRSSTHPNDAKGRKRKMAKAMLKRGKGKDLSNVDLAFRPSEARDTDGRWKAGHDAQRLGAKMVPTQAKLYAAKNSMAQAMLSKNPRKIRKAEKHLKKAQWAHTQYTNAQAAVGRASSYYEAKAARDVTSLVRGW